MFSGFSKTSAFNDTMRIVINRTESPQRRLETWKLWLKNARKATEMSQHTVPSCER